MNRREFLLGGLVNLGAALIGGKEASPKAVDDREIKAVELRITCTAEILERPRTRGVKMWIPVPPRDDSQEITGFFARSRFAHKITESSPWGNRMLFLNMDDVQPGDKITLICKVRRRRSGVSKDPHERPKMHMEPSEWEKWDDNMIKYADEVVGNEKDPIKIGRKIYEALLVGFKYIHEACGRGVSSITLEEKAGRCDEFHALFRSLMMYKGVPVKWEQGILLPYPSVMGNSGELEADCIHSRSWVKFYIGHNKWMPVDISEAMTRPELKDFCFGKLPPNRIKMSTGRGLELSPKQEGIINTFPYAYAESDGIPLIYGHNYRNILKYELIKMEM